MPALHLEPKATRSPRVPAGWDFEIPRPPATKPALPVATMVSATLVAMWAAGWMWIGEVSDNDNDLLSPFVLALCAVIFLAVKAYRFLREHASYKRKRRAWVRENTQQQLLNL